MCFLILAIEITSPPEIPTVGDTATFTCTSLLGQANMIEWLLVDGTSETAVDTRNDQATLDLVFNPVSESMNGRVYRCRVTIGGGTVDQDVTVTVEGEPFKIISQAPPTHFGLYQLNYCFFFKVFPECK